MIVARLRQILEIVRYLPRLSPFLAGLLGLVVLVQPALTVTFVLGAGELIHKVPGLVSRHASLDTAAALLGLVAAVFLIQQMVPQVQTLLVTAVSRRLEDQLRERATALMLAPATGSHLEDPHVRDQLDLLLHARHGDVGFAGGVVGGLARLGGEWLTKLALFSLLGAIRWWLGIVALLVVGGVSALQFAEALRLQHYGRMWSLGRRNGYLRRILGTEPETAKEVRIFALAPWLRARWEAGVRVFLADFSSVVFQRSPLALASLICSVPGMLLAVLLVAWMAADGQLTVAQLVVAGQAFLQLGGPNSLNYFELAPMLVARVPTLRALERSLTPSPSPPKPPLPPAVPHRELRVEGLCFSYPGAAQPVLRSLDLVVPAHRSLAIVGENGAGKTTLVRLLCQLYEPEAGRVTVDGLDLRDYDPTSWQRRVAAILQDFVRYPLPARDNVGLGSVDRAQDRAALVEAAARAGVLDVIQHLPEGWDTPLSREVPGGTDLSGGQWQRIALARALMSASRGAGLLILDEPAANLDVRGEAELNRRFLEMTNGLTTIVISHRLSTVRHADRICVMESGQVVEEGDHASLLKDGGRYAGLFELQAARFREQES